LLSNQAGEGLLFGAAGVKLPGSLLAHGLRLREAGHTSTQLRAEL
jgi:hypothetical protein